MKHKPMLARDWIEAKVKFPCYIQPKIDGVRALNQDGTLINFFDYQPITVNRTKQPCIRDLIFQYYKEETHSIVLARELTNSYIAELMKH